MTDLAAFEPSSPFDHIRHIDADGEHWFARELMALMGYSTWERFAAVVAKAAESLAVVQGDDQAAANFRKIAKVTGSRGPAAADVRLTRFAAYLTAMAGDDTKEQVAGARVYFAVKTREAETAPRFQIPGTYAEALRLAAAQAEEIEAARARLAIAEPKAEYVDGFVEATEDTTLIRVFANQLGVQEKKLRIWLQERGLIYKDRYGQWKPKAGHPDWFVLRDQPEAPRLHNDQMRTTLYVTPVGKTAIRRLAMRHPIGGVA